MRILFGLAIAVAASSAFAADPIDCGYGPGRSICGYMQRLDSSLVSCSGAGCYGVWGETIRASESLAEAVAYDVFPGDVVNWSVAGLADRTSRTLCGMEWTGEAAWIQRLIVSSNRALRAMATLQRGANLPPYTCTMSET